MVDDASPDPKPRGGMGRGVKILLFASLALNLVIAGIVIGAVLSGGPFGGDRPRGPDRTDAVAPYTRAFTDPQRREIRRALRDAIGGRTARNAWRDALAEDYREALTLLRADPFEPDRLAAVLERQTQRSETRRAAGQAVLTGYIAAMSDDERRAFADRLEEGIARFVERRLGRGSK